MSVIYLTKSCYRSVIANLDHQEALYKTLNNYRSAFFILFIIASWLCLFKVEKTHYILFQSFCCRFTICIGKNATAN